MERAALQGYATATDLADYLVKKGLPFRDAHEAVAHAVQARDRATGVDLAELPLAVLQRLPPGDRRRRAERGTAKGSLASRNVLGGTAPEQVRAQIARHRARLGAPRPPSTAAAAPAASQRNGMSPASTSRVMQAQTVAPRATRFA